MAELARPKAIDILFLLPATPGDAGTGIALEDPVVNGAAVPKALGLSISTKDFRRWPGEPVFESAMLGWIWAEARDD